jgi:hypothetical protein
MVTKRKMNKCFWNRKKKRHPWFTAIFNLFFSLYIFFQTNICRSMNESTLQNAYSNIQKAHGQKKRGKERFCFSTAYNGIRGRVTQKKQEQKANIPTEVRSLRKNRQRPELTKHANKVGEQFTEQMALQAAERHVLVDEQPLVPLRAEPDQANKILMIQHCQHEHLYQELVTTLHTILSELLHCYHLQITKEQYETKKSDL